MNNILDFQNAIMIAIQELPEFPNNSFAFGEQQDFASTGADKYPLFFLLKPIIISHPENNFTIQQRQVTFTITQYISNQNDNPFAITSAQGFCEDLCYKVLEKLTEKRLMLVLKNTVSISQIDPNSLESGDDRVAGISCDVSIKYNRC